MSLRQVLRDIDQEATRIARSVAARRRTSPFTPLHMDFPPKAVAPRPHNDEVPQVAGSPVLALAKRVEAAARPEPDPRAGPLLRPSPAESRAEVVARRLFDIFGIRALKKLFGRR